jgi:hypothetical protein
MGEGDLSGAFVTPRTDPATLARPLFRVGGPERASPPPTTVLAVPRFDPDRSERP